MARGKHRQRHQKGARGQRSRSSSSQKPSRERGFIQLKATVDKNRKGFAHLIFDSRDYDDAFVPPRDTGNLFHGDRVLVTVNQHSEVVGLKILEHRYREIVGRYNPASEGSRQKVGFITHQRKNAVLEV